MTLTTKKCEKISVTRVGLYLALYLVGIVTLNFTSNCLAGAYIFAGSGGRSADIVTHPKGYNGTSGVVTVGVCIDPGGAVSQITSQQQAIDISINNVINTYNSLQITTGNVKTNDSRIPNGKLDFESIAMHEVGHCIGLGHPNLGAQSSFDRNSQNFKNLTNLTFSTVGVNGSFDFDENARDRVYGSGDDLRGDDINLHWFRKSDNNPFSIASTVDSTTYSRNLADLPVGLGYTYAANADRTVAAELFGLPNTEAVMQQGTERRETQRTLNADDVATLRYAMSGDDELAGTGDDYTIKLVYRDFTTGGPCDITMKFDNATSLAVCSTRAEGPKSRPNHMRITQAEIFFVNDAATWYFNNTPNIVDSTPDNFKFNSIANVPRNNVIISNNIIVSGINTATSISISSGQYSINGGNFRSDSQTLAVTNGDMIRIMHQSSVSFSTSTTTQLTVGGILATFASTTVSSNLIIDVTPDNFNFINKNDVPLGTLIMSNPIQITGINAAAQIFVSGSLSSAYSLDNGNTFENGVGFVNNGAFVIVKHTSSEAISTETNTTLIVGGIANSTFTSTTASTPRGGNNDTNAPKRRSGGGILNILAILLLFSLAGIRVLLFRYSNQRHCDKQRPKIF